MTGVMAGAVEASLLVWWLRMGWEPSQPCVVGRMTIDGTTMHPRRSSRLWAGRMQRRIAPDRADFAPAHLHSNGPTFRNTLHPQQDADVDVSGAH
jgi:hypothetical protein